MSDKEQMLSLYDYLGQAAGAALGKQVAEYAKIKRAKYGTREVNTKKYQGIVMLYEKSFLDEFFHKNDEDYTSINTKLVAESFKLTEEIQSNI